MRERGVPSGDQVVVVTGAAQGIGAATLAAFAESGATVAALDANATALTATVASLAAGGNAVTAFPVDVTDESALTAVVADVERKLGPIEVLVNGAGVLRTGAAADMSTADWAALFAVNATGVFLASTTVARYMIPRRSGAIVTISSNAGAVPRAGMAGYAASKAAATMFTKSLGLELARHGIRCNVVAPGSTDTPMLRGMWPENRDPGEAIADLVAGSPTDHKGGIPLEKIALPRDIAAAVLFLASAEAGHITMQELLVDGGAALGG
ncbi:2,3-dihydro-2,3-dihydroxybenzoate dehydrogenase [Prauserella marina]|uniref:2,3-dihydro-2,3-dihydroxybenzoate dehydrogenase n=1 Tax=Prauserella marina TaxID=530584 RepID=UPI001FE8076C|nr:2,3-dihydro-2,3-dihydroxybenzoate dehydrogenase [Prauserella marina]